MPRPLSRDQAASVAELLVAAPHVCQDLGYNAGGEAGRAGRFLKKKYMGMWRQASRIENRMMATLHKGYGAECQDKEEEYQLHLRLLRRARRGEIPACAVTGHFHPSSAPIIRGDPMPFGVVFKNEWVINMCSGLTGQVWSLYVA